jgi:hypothetical protein
MMRMSTPSPSNRQAPSCRGSCQCKSICRSLSRSTQRPVLAWSAYSPRAGTLIPLRRCDGEENVVRRIYSLTAAWTEELLSNRPTARPPLFDWNIHLDETARRGCGEGRCNLREPPSDQSPSPLREHDNCDLPTFKILLKAYVSVGRDEDVEAGRLGGIEQFAVLERIPAVRACLLDLVTYQSRRDASAECRYRTEPARFTRRVRRDCGQRTRGQP